MKISAAVLAAVSAVEENWDICPSKKANDGCYEQDVAWTGSNSQVTCTMTNPSCMNVTCAVDSITANLRADLFHTNLKDEDTFMQQLQKSHRTLERVDKPGVPLEENKPCGFEVTSDGVRLNKYDYKVCDVAPSMNAQGDIVYSVQLISKGNAPGIPTIEFYVDTVVEASCKYDSKFVVNAEGFWINQEDVQAATEKSGDLKETFDCKFYSDPGYSKQINSNHLINMGQTVYGRVESDELAGLSYNLVGVTVFNKNNESMKLAVIENGVTEPLVNAQSDGGAETGRIFNYFCLIKIVPLLRYDVIGH